MSFDEPARSGGAPKIAFVAALALECASLRREAPRQPRWQILQSGPGAARAAAAATRGLAAGAGMLVSWGLAGGLEARVAPGVVVLPRRVTSRAATPHHVDGGAHERLSSLAADFTLEGGDLLTTPAALETPAAKRAAAAETGAVAVDMESAAIAAVAAQAGVPFVALRVIVDGVDDALPAGAETWIDAQGNQRTAAALRAVASPRQWGALVTLAKRYRVASRTLDRLASALASRRLLAPEVTALEAGT